MNKNLIILTSLVMQIPFLMFSVKAQTHCGTTTPGWGLMVFDYPLAPEIRRISFDVRGADGGNATVSNVDIFGNTSTCVAFGGSGARVQAEFGVGSGSGEIPAGSELMLVTGRQGESHSSNVSLGTGYAYGGGGGGTAVLYRAPSSSIWNILVVAGGGGGAYQGMFLTACVDNENGQGGRSGVNAGSGNGDFTPGEGGFAGTSGEGGGEGGLLSGGGGGTFSDGGGIFCIDFHGGGKAGFPMGGQGGSNEGCLVGELFKSGGYGFGGGGAGRGAGGGGGGYSGGGGGGSTGRGGGGASAVHPMALSQTITAGGSDFPALDGSVTITCSQGPVAICKNATLDLSESGEDVLEIEDINNGSYDPEGGPTTMALSAVNFNCDSVGVRTVTLTVYDNESYSSDCTAEVTIRDITPPKIFCHDPISINVTDPSLCGAVVPYYMACDDCNSCDIVQIAGLPIGAVFPVGTTINTFVAIDASGNRSDTCSFTVTVHDSLAATAVCYSYIDLLPDEFGNYIPDPALINYGSYDNCGIGSLTVSPSIIPCVHDSYKQMVLLFVKDIYGNLNACTSEITLLGDDDCDGVGNICDQCPGGDDQVDNNHDGLPDCASFPGMEHLPDTWKCGNGKKVQICHVVSLDPFVTRSLCVSPNAAAAHLAHGDYLGPCGSVGGACTSIDDLQGLQSSGLFSANNTVHSTNDMSIALYPNPNQGEFTVNWDNFDGTSPISVSVYSVLGKKVWEKSNLFQNEHTLLINLDKHTLSAGMYYLQVINGGETRVKTFIVE